MVATDRNPYCTYREEEIPRHNLGYCIRAALEYSALAAIVGMVGLADLVNWLFKITVRLVLLAIHLITHPAVVISAIAGTVATLVLIGSFDCLTGKSCLVPAEPAQWVWDNFMSQPWWPQWHGWYQHLNSAR